MLARGDGPPESPAPGGTHPPRPPLRRSAASDTATIRTSSAISAATLTVTPSTDTARHAAAAASRYRSAPIPSACRNAALPARNSATPQPRARHGPAGSAVPVFTMACLTPEDSATTPSSIGM